MSSLFEPGTSRGHGFWHFAAGAVFFPVHELHVQYALEDSMSAAFRPSLSLCRGQTSAFVLRTCTMLNLASDVWHVCAYLEGGRARPHACVCVCVKFVPDVRYLPRRVGSACRRPHAYIPPPLPIVREICQRIAVPLMRGSVTCV